MVKKWYVHVKRYHPRILSNRLIQIQPNNSIKSCQILIQARFWKILKIAHVCFPEIRTSHKIKIDSIYKSNDY